MPSRRLPSGGRAASRLKSEQSRSAAPGSAKAGPPLRSGPPSQERGSRAFGKCLPRDADVATEVASQPTRFTAERATRQLWRVWQRVSVEVTLSAGEEAGHLCAARHCPAPPLPGPAAARPRHCPALHLAPLCAARHCPAPPLPGPAPGIRRRLCLSHTPEPHSVRPGGRHLSLGWCGVPWRGPAARCPCARTASRDATGSAAWAWCGRVVACRAELAVSSCPKAPQALHRHQQRAGPGFQACRPRLRVRGEWHLPRV